MTKAGGMRFGKNVPTNKYAKNIIKNYDLHFKKGELNDLNCYLYGMALKDMEKTDQAIDAFIEALNQNPFLWTAWLELCLIICHNFDFSDGVL
jgi:tetratricopeptide (TPR) repeat protein